VTNLIAHSGRTPEKHFPLPDLAEIIAYQLHLTSRSTHCEQNIHNPRAIPSEKPRPSQIFLSELDCAPMEVSILHDHGNAFFGSSQQRNILERIAVHDQEVRQSAGADASKFS
jgi:hypothetical protein